jgi:hypothetical protein
MFVLCAGGASRVQRVEQKKVGALEKNTVDRIIEDGIATPPNTHFTFKRRSVTGMAQ